MCGIFAGNDIRELASLNVKRGNIAFGGLSVAPKREVIFRYYVPYNEYLEIPQGEYIFAHSLAPTGEAKRVHPFESDRFILAHNGILLNYQQFKEWRLGPVDSQYLLGGIEYCVSQLDYIPIDAIKEVNQVIQGQRACWMWDKFDKIAYFWRVMSPLYYSNSKFSSVKFQSSHLLREGVIYSFDLKELVEKQNFSYYSPYEY